MCLKTSGYECTHWEQDACFQLKRAMPHPLSFLISPPPPQKGLAFALVFNSLSPRAATWNISSFCSTLYIKSESLQVIIL